MLIGLISDTHIPDQAQELPPQIKDIFCGVDLILHAGDVYEVSVLDELECLAPVLAARGDDDLEVLGDRRVKDKHILTIDGVTIWLTHQRYWDWDEHDWSVHRPNVIVFGHTHKTKIEYQKEGVLLINPGSPTFPHYRQELGTVALLTVSSGKAKAHLVQLG